jgi:hypothetical protein
LTYFPLGTYNESDLITERTYILAKQNELAKSRGGEDIEHISKQLEMLDRRLDSVDSIVSAVAERVMKQPLSLNITCSRCGHKIEIALIGIEKPGH